MGDTVTASVVVVAVCRAWEFDPWKACWMGDMVAASVVVVVAVAVCRAWELDPWEAC
jgi:hypothetical protein